jgi:drug/metabolite transporter superfamily protein YnfA
VFLLPDLNVFVLALGLSLAGVVLGIALRIRAFLYAGIAFMLLNVFGQLIRFYPDQALGKAVVLMGAGMMILGAMIWFNLKKMQIMQRFDLIRVELEAWD